MFIIFTDKYFPTEPTNFKNGVQGSIVEITHGGFHKNGLDTNNYFPGVLTDRLTTDSSQNNLNLYSNTGHNIQYKNNQRKRPYYKKEGICLFSNVLLLGLVYMV